MQAFFDWARHRDVLLRFPRPEELIDVPRHLAVPRGPELDRCEYVYIQTASFLASGIRFRGRLTSMSRTCHHAIGRSPIVSPAGYA